MTTRITNLAMDLFVLAEIRLAADGVLCEKDQEVLVGLKKLGAKTDRLDRARRASRTLEDACEWTPHAQRLMAESDRDLAPILALSPNLPRHTEVADDTA